MKLQGRPITERDGFTLMEALVALAILAIASVGLIRATEAHIDTVRGLQTRAVAQWVAENRLAELGLQRGPPTDGSEHVEMLGRAWTVAVDVQPSQDPDLAQVTIAVSPEGSRNTSARLTGARLSGFVDLGRTSA